MLRITITEVIFDEYHDATKDWGLDGVPFHTEGAARLEFEAVVRDIIAYKHTKVRAEVSFPRTIVYLEYKSPGASADDIQYVDGFTITEYTPDN